MFRRAGLCVHPFWWVFFGVGAVAAMESKGGILEREGCSEDFVAFFGGERVWIISSFVCIRAYM